TVGLAASGDDYVGVTASLRVSVTDDDSPGLSVAPSPLAVDEGGSGKLRVRLADKPAGGREVALVSDNSEVTLAPASLRFTADNWDTVQEVEVSAAEDDDAVGDSADITLTASGGGYANETASVTVNVTENDRAVLVLSPETLGVTEESSGSFTVALASEPSGAVTVRLARSGDTDVTVNPTSLSFTASNWKRPQTVTASAAADTDTEADRATIGLTASGGDYAGVTGEVAVTVTDNDKPGLVLSPASLRVDEGGSRTFEVSLVTQPSGEVTVRLSQDDDATNEDVTLDKTTLTFTASNWGTTQEVEVSAGDDSDAIDDSATIELTASGGGYGGVTRSVEVAVRDTDEAKLTITAGSDPLAVEEGKSAAFSVKLASEPSGAVTVDLSRSGDTDVTVDKSTLTFTAGNWNTAQEIEVSAAEDLDAIDDRAAIELSASGGGYGGVSGSVEVKVDDDETAALTITADKDPLEVDEGGEKTFTVRLASEPSGAVTVGLSRSGDTDVTVDKSTLTFTAGNWNTAQEIEVSAGDDADAIDDTATIKLTASGGGYRNITGSLTVTVNDDEEPGLTLSVQSLEIGEGAGGEKTFTVALASEPSGAVTVELARSGDTDVTLDKIQLTFTVDNWNTAQTVTVSAAEDADLLDERATISLSASGADYGGVSGEVAVTVDDNDEATLVITAAEPFEVAEGRSASFTVQLESEPSGEVTVELAQGDDTANDDVRLDKAALTFTTDNWGTPQSVTVRAVQDDDAVNDIVTLTLTAAGGGYAGVSDSVTVTVKDDDEAGLVLSDRHLSFEEGESASFKVQLKTRPSADVTVALGRPDHPDIRVDKISLRFTADDWNTAQTVTVSAAEDDDADNET
ncbi:MAG: hypothetical protein ISN29_00115, partial [Gammaproteobacteria bacterium AqS3]|nr:hypothetical protein [Gammaproteobacteria bacterium AqS3]